jgi:hypothetical protein
MGGEPRGKVAGYGAWLAMIGVSVTIHRFVDESQPGWVECGFTDAWNQERTFIEKVPVVTTEYLNANSQYPARGVIACEVVERHLDASGREVLTIDTGRPWGCESTTGEIRFEVVPGQIVQI